MERASARCGVITTDFAENQRYCRPCKAEYMKEYREHNRDRVNELNRRSHARNAEKRRAQQREYWKRRKEQGHDA